MPRDQMARPGRSLTEVEGVLMWASGTLVLEQCEEVALPYSPERVPK